MARAPGAGKTVFCYLDARDYAMFTRAISRVGSTWPPISFSRLQRLASFIERSAKMRAPKATGTLAKNIYSQVVGNKIVRVYADTYYARMQEFGYQPHWVSPYRFPSVYIWALMKGFWPIPAVIFVKGHKPFLIPAYNSAMSQLRNIFVPGNTLAWKAAFAAMRKPRGA